MSKLRLTLPLLAAVAFLATGCELWPNASGVHYTTTDPISDFGHATQTLYATITYIVLVIFVLVSILLAVTLVRFRDDGQPGNPEQIHGNTQMEIGWTLLPILIVLSLIIPTVRTIFKIADAPPAGGVDPVTGEVLLDEDGRPAKPTVEVRVIGKRWWWAFEYVNEQITTGNHLVVPDDRPVSLLIMSDTVIHSFWAPRIGGKRDAVPGRVNRLWFQLDLDVPKGEPEHIRGQCAEYCGEAHSLMRFEVLALDGEDYDDWVAEYQEGPTFADASVKAKGEEAFGAGGCTACHSITGNPGAVGAIGPNLTFFGDRRYVGAGIKDLYGGADTQAVLTDWIRHPDAIKPGTAILGSNGEARFDGMVIPLAKGDGILSEEDLSKDTVDAIVAYLLAQKSSFPTPGIE